MGQAEAYIEGYLCDKAKALSFLCFKFNSGVNGVPDRILIGNGHTIFIETKAPKEGPRPLQQAIIRKMRAAGAACFVCNSRAQIDQILEYVENNPNPVASCVNPML